MLRTVSEQPTLWESILPAAVLGMPAELVAVDRLLDDPRFFEPYRRFFHARLGRPSVPIETYLRLMFLKYRYKLGFEPLCREVADSICWSRFCRIPLGGSTPHPTTLMKITTRCGEAAVNELNEALLAKAAEAKVLKTNRVRADTTVVEANVAYPSDSSLLAKGVARLAKLARRARAQGLATRTPLRDRTRSVYRRARDVVNTLRQRDSLRPARVRRLNAELAQIARASVRDAQAVIRNARRRVRELGDRATGRQRAIIEDLATLAERLAAVAAQTRQRVIEGVTPSGATRIVSLHDPDARPIVKGKLGKPVEFGYKAQLVDNEDGVIVDHNIEQGNPPDAPMLAPAIERIARRAGRVPEAVTADRGYGEAAVEDALHEIGVRHVVLPRKGKPNADRREIQNRRAFKKMVRWRTGCEGRISCAKRDFGLARTRIDGLAGARTWCGHGIFNHNLVKIAGLLQ
ncbi:MAG: ISNCY family transposase [Acidimicrobiia bacterium]